MWNGSHFRYPADDPLPEIPTFGDKKTGGLQVLVIGEGGEGSGAFCFKIFDVLAQLNEFSTDIAITFGPLLQQTGV